MHYSRSNKTYYSMQNKNAPLWNALPEALISINFSKKLSSSPH